MNGTIGEQVELNSGAWLIPVPGEPRQQFGMVSAWSPGRSPGTVRLDLRAKSTPLTVRTSEDGLVIFMPEAHANMLGQTLLNCAREISLLRGLYKGEQLAERAVFPPGIHNTEHDGELLFRPAPDEPVAAHPYPLRTGFLKDEVALLMTRDDVLIAALRVDETELDSYSGTLLFDNLPPSLMEAFRIQKETAIDPTRQADREQAKAAAEAFGVYAWCTTDKRRVNIANLFIDGRDVGFSALD